MDGVGDEEDALDGVAGEGLAGGWVERLHVEDEELRLIVEKPGIEARYKKSI